MEAELLMYTTYDGRMTYRQYLFSPWWVARKAAIIRYRGYRCERCGAEPNTGLQLHHKTYERLGHELPEDLELLCRGCHQREHRFKRDPGRRWWWDAGPDYPREVRAIVQRQFGITL